MNKKLLIFIGIVVLIFGTIIYLIITQQKKSTPFISGGVTPYF